MEITLTRTDQLFDGTFGKLQLPSFSLFTLEDDWKDNEPQFSCIPAGRYPLRRRWSNKHKQEVFEVMNVPGRSNIEIHPGNTEEDTLGCILPGTSRGLLMVKRDEDTGEIKKVKEGVLSSRLAFSRFMFALRDLNEAMLNVVWAPGLPKGVTV